MQSKITRQSCPAPSSDVLPRRERVYGPNGSYWEFPVPSGEKAELTVEELIVIARQPALRAGRTPTRTRERKPTVASLIGQMKRAGLDIAACEINPREGTFKIVTGKPVQMNADDDRNEWDTVQ